MSNSSHSVELTEMQIIEAVALMNVPSFETRRDGTPAATGKQSLPPSGSGTSASGPAMPPDPAGA